MSLAVRRLLAANAARHHRRKAAAQLFRLSIAKRLRHFALNEVTESRNVAGCQLFYSCSNASGQNRRFSLGIHLHKRLSRKLQSFEYRQNTSGMIQFQSGRIFVGDRPVRDGYRYR
jgi:hypothetical protein